MFMSNCSDLTYCKYHEFLTIVNCHNI